MDIINFGTDDIDNHLAQMDDAQLDNLAFGAILLDGAGTIVSYNAAEGEITGRDPQAVIGRNFFDEVAPCTNDASFYGRFREGVASGELNALFQYTFDYQMRPTRVRVQMKKAQETDRYWVLVQRV